MAFQYIAIEGPIGVGKTSARRAAGHAAGRGDDAGGRGESVPGRLLCRARRRGAAGTALLPAQPHQQQLSIRQGDLFAQSTVCDYLFDKDKIFAYLNLDDNELFIYQRLYDLLARDVAAPDLVIYLQAPTDVLMRRLRDRAARADGDSPEPSQEYLRELNEAYQHFFFHYSATPLLVVETSQFDLSGSDDALDDLIRQINAMGRGTRYYVPRA